MWLLSTRVHICSRILSLRHSLNMLMHGGWIFVCTCPQHGFHSWNHFVNSRLKTVSKLHFPLACFDVQMLISLPSAFCFEVFITFFYEKNHWIVCGKGKNWRWMFRIHISGDLKTVWSTAPYMPERSVPSHSEPASSLTGCYWVRAPVILRIAPITEFLPVSPHSQPLNRWVGRLVTPPPSQSGWLSWEAGKHQPGACGNFSKLGRGAQDLTKSGNGQAAAYYYVCTENIYVQYFLQMALVAPFDPTLPAQKSCEDYRFYLFSPIQALLQAQLELVWDYLHFPKSEDNLQAG